MFIRYWVNMKTRNQLLVILQFLFPYHTCIKRMLCTLFSPVSPFQGSCTLGVSDIFSVQIHGMFCCSARKFLDPSQSACSLQTHKKTPWNRTQCIQTHRWHGVFSKHYLFYANYFLFETTLYLHIVPHPAEP